MIYEQAFMALPEFLTGLPYNVINYEGTLVSAFSMAVLQELNGRNINNPISCLRSEVEYFIAPNKRADLHLDLKAMRILSQNLMQYGVLRHNWLEAKFFRLNAAGKVTQDPTRATLSLLKDIIRLIAFPDERAFPKSTASRYLLHAYQGGVGLHSAYKRTTTKNVSAFVRSWLPKIRMAGQQKITDIHAGIEAGVFEEVVGKDLRSLELTCDAGRPQI